MQITQVSLSQDSFSHFEPLCESDLKHLTSNQSHVNIETFYKRFFAFIKFWVNWSWNLMYPVCIKIMDNQIPRIYPRQN